MRPLLACILVTCAMAVASPASAQSAPAAPIGAGFGPAPAQLPPAPAPGDAETTHRRSTPMMVTGIVMSGLGTVAIPTGALVILASNCMDCSESMMAERRLPGIALAAAGVALVGAGIPLWVIGAQHVPASQASAPTIRVGAGAADVTFRF